MVPTGRLPMPYLRRLFDALLSVPVRLKIIGIVMLPVLILGVTLNYWITTGLSDWLSYVLTDQRVQAAMAAGSRSVTLVTVLAALGSIVFALALTFLLTHPLLDLRRVALAVSSGRLASRATVWSRDEIGEVAAAVNTMLDGLVSGQEQLARANQRLEALNQVAMAAGRELALPEVLQAILQGLARLGFPQGWVYLRDGEAGRFYLAQHHQLPADLLARLQIGFADTPCSCQAALLAGELATACLRPQCARLAAAPSGQGLSHLSVPLRARGQVFGVLNLACPPQAVPSTEDLDLMTAVGGQAAEILANAWLHARLVEKETARRALLESLVETQDDERNRLARELHDGAGQTLTSLLVRLKSLERQAPPGPMREGLERLQALAAGSIEQVRELSYQLHPATLEAFGLARALENLVNETARAAGLEVSTHFAVQRSLPREAQTALYRIAQEGLANIVRHARARHVEVELAETPLGVALRLEDDGCGFDPDCQPLRAGRPHLGLISMQERAEMLGGSLAVLSAPGAGTAVHVRLPLLEESPHA